MKTTKIHLLIACLCLFASTAFAQITLGIDGEQSKISWKGEIPGQQDPIRGEAKIKGGKMELDGTKLKGGNVDIDMNSIALVGGGSAVASEVLKNLKGSSVLQTDKYPTSSFVVKDVKYLGGSTVKIKGDLTVKNITKEVEFDATASFEKGKMILQADDIKIDLGAVKSEEKKSSGGLLGKVAQIGLKTIGDNFSMGIKLVTEAQISTKGIKEGLSKFKKKW